MVRMILDLRGCYPSRWSAVVSVAEKIGCAPQTLHECVKKAKVHKASAGVPTDTADKLKALKVRTASCASQRDSSHGICIFAQAELDRSVQAMIAFIEDKRALHRVEPVRMTVSDRAAPCPLVTLIASPCTCAK